MVCSAAFDETAASRPLPEPHRSRTKPTFVLLKGNAPMSSTVVIFEDSGYRNLLPLTHTRPACRLRCGIETLCEKVRAAFDGKTFVLHARREVADVAAVEIPNITVNAVSSESALFVNGRLIAPPDFAKIISIDGDDCAYVCGKDVVAARISGALLKKVGELMEAGPLPDGWASDLKKVNVELPLIKYPWDLISNNPGQIKSDFQRMGLGGKVAGKVHESATLVDKANIHIADGAQVHPGAILIAEGGPIYVGPGAKVMAGAVLEGPVSIGPKSAVKMLAKIYEGTSMGAFCKVGGEVEECIFQAYSNKQHDGFVGHAFFGEWVNLGADTNNSDLKNNYGNVKVTIDGKQIDSGSMFVGSTVGDHSKTGINTMLNTGTVIGVGCNVYGADFPPKYVPSFCWGGAAGMVEHELPKFIDTAQRVMGRRDRELTPAHRKMLEKVHRDTADERKKVLR